MVQPLPFSRLASLGDGRRLADTGFSDHQRGLGRIGFKRALEALQHRCQRFVLDDVVRLSKCAGIPHLAYRPQQAGIGRAHRARLDLFVHRGGVETAQGRDELLDFIDVILVYSRDLIGKGEGLTSGHTGANDVFQIAFDRVVPHVVGRSNDGCADERFIMRRCLADILQGRHNMAGPPWR